jgi:two-component system, OmpR family, alkaline phosphatase synthesis response regulator PhoP
VNLFRLSLLARDSEATQALMNGLVYRGFACTIIPRVEDLADSKAADLLLIETEDEFDALGFRETLQKIKQIRHAPIVLLINKEALRETEKNSDVSDFIIRPYDIDELSTRIRRLLQKGVPTETSSDYLKAGDVVIDLPKCEVWVRGKVVDLTFTEYELLKLLMSKKGQVLTREVLLNKIWGYDYFGGDRTVDVHITRLRNKIEDTTHNIIETVRNIGYRIKTNDQ